MSITEDPKNTVPKDSGLWELAVRPLVARDLDWYNATQFYDQEKSSTIFDEQLISCCTVDS